MSQPRESRRSGATSRAETLSLRELAEAVLAEKRSVIIIACVFVAAGVAYALLATQWFEADVVATYAEKKGANSPLGSLGSLASVAGLNLEPANTTEPLAILKSHHLIRDFIQDRGLVNVLMPTKGWWGHERPPDIRDAVIFFDKNVRDVKEDKKTGLITLSIRWTDPVVAADWANSLIDRVNAEMQARAEVEAAKNLAYLQGELGATNIPSLQQAIARLIESEMQKAMLAKGNREFAFKIIDPATVPKYRAFPKRTLIVLGAGILGGLLSVAWVLVLREYRHPRQETV
jgi:uncharacterized protein involved in exopolysaccharide biosynthesis